MSIPDTSLQNQIVSAPVQHAANTEFLLTERNPLSYDTQENAKSFSAVDALTKGIPLSVASGAYSLYNSTLGLVTGKADLGEDLKSYDSAWADYYGQNKGAIDLAGNVEALLIPGAGALKVLNLAKNADTALGSMAFIRTLGNLDRAASIWRKEAVAAGINQATADTLISATWKARGAEVASAVQDSLVLNTFAFATMNQSQMYSDYDLSKFTSDVLLGGVIGAPFNLIKNSREISSGINEAQSFFQAKNYIQGNYAGTPTWAKMHGLIADAENVQDVEVAAQARNKFLGLAKELVPAGQENLQYNLQPYLQQIKPAEFWQDFAGVKQISVAKPIDTDLSSGAGIKNFLTSRNLLVQNTNTEKNQIVHIITPADAADVKKGTVAGQSVFIDLNDAQAKLTEMNSQARTAAEPDWITKMNNADRESINLSRDMLDSAAADGKLTEFQKARYNKLLNDLTSGARTTDVLSTEFDDLASQIPSNVKIQRNYSLKASMAANEAQDAYKIQSISVRSKHLYGPNNSNDVKEILYAPTNASWENANVLGQSAKEFAQAVKDGKIPSATPSYFINLLTGNKVENVTQTAGDLGIKFADPRTFYLNKQVHEFNKFEGFFDVEDPAVADGMFLSAIKQAENPQLYFKTNEAQKATFKATSTNQEVPKWAVSDTNLLGLQGIYAQSVANGNTLIPVIEGGVNGVLKYKTTKDVGDMIRDLKDTLFKEGVKRGLTLDDLAVRLNLNATKWVLGDKSEFALYRDAKNANAYASPINARVDLDVGNLPTREEYLASLDRNAIAEAQRVNTISIQAPAFDDLIPHDSFVDGYKSKDFLPRTGLAGTFSFGGQSKVASFASYVERIGALVQEATLKYKTANQQAILPSVSAIQKNPNALFELNNLINLARSLPSGYRFVQDTRQIEGKAVTVGKIQNAETGAFIKDQRNNSLDLTISPTVTKFYQDYASIKNDFISKANAIAEAKGETSRIDPDDLYFPPVDVRNRDFFAFIKGKDGQVTSITAGSADDLRAQAETLKAQFGDAIDVIYKDDIKDYKKRFGDFDADQFFRSYSLDSAVRRSGRLSTLAPGTNDTSLKEVLNFMDRSADNLIRGATSNYMAKQFEELHFLGQQYTEASASKRGPLASLSFKADNPYQDYINTALNKSKLSTVPVLESLNNSLNLVVSKAFNEIQKATDFTSDKPLDVDQGIRQIAKKYGIQFNYAQPDLLKTINATYQKDAASSIVSRFNGIMTKLTLSLDAMFHATNFISGALMQMPEMMNLKRNLKDPAILAQIEDLTGVKIPGTDVQYPSMMKIMSKSIMKLLDKNDQSLQGYVERGLVQSDVLKYRDTQLELADLMGKPPVTLPGKGLKAVNDGLTNAANFADKWATRPIEKFLQYMSVDAAQQYMEAAGVKDQALIDTVSNLFARRTTGNYISGQRPIIFQGPLGHALGLFQTFMFAVGQNLTRYIAEGDKAALATFGIMQTGLFGAQSNPIFNAINYHIGKNNASRQDLFSAAYSYGGVGDWLLYGVPSNALNLSLYTRGDLTPINPTILPTSLQEIPIVGATLKIGQNIANTLKVIKQGGGDGDTFLRAVAMNGLNRPLAGMAMLADGRSFFNSGETINSSIRDWTAWTRVVGGRPFDEQKMLDSYYRQKYYESYDINQLKTLGTAIKSKIAGGAEPSDDEVKTFLNNYIQAGGNARNFQRYWTQQVISARTDLSDRLYAKMANSPKFDEYRAILGGTSIRNPNGSFFGEQPLVSPASAPQENLAPNTEFQQ